MEIKVKKKLKKIYVNKLNDKLICLFLFTIPVAPSKSSKTTTCIHSYSMCAKYTI